MRDKVDSVERWWPAVKGLRDILIHRPHTTLVFGDIGDRLLFQVYEDVREEAKILDDRLMDPSGPNIVDFWLYAGWVVAELLVFLEDLVDLIAKHLDVSASPTGNTGNFKALAGSLDRLLGTTT